jgi:flavorubredoxin
VGIIGLSAPLPLDRVQLLNPGESIAIGDRTLTAVKPPVFDNPCTTGFYDNTSGVLFSSDYFGALFSAVPESAAEISDDDLRDARSSERRWTRRGSTRCTGTRSPRSWTASAAWSPTMILSGHLPAAPGDMAERLLSSLAAAPTARPFVGPDHAALEQMLKEMTAGPQ